MMQASTIGNSTSDTGMDWITYISWYVVDEASTLAGEKIMEQLGITGDINPLFVQMGKWSTMVYNVNSTISQFPVPMIMIRNYKCEYGEW